MTTSRETESARSAQKDVAPARVAPLAMDAATFRALGRNLVDQLAELLAQVPNGPLTPAETPAQVRAALDLSGSLPERGEDPGPLLERTAELLFRHSLFNGHPRFFGYITSSPAPIGMLGDLLAAALNPNVGAFVLGPAATEIEAQTVRWIAELMGYPTDCGGIMVSGGNMANFLGFFAARLDRAPGNIRERGVAEIAPRMRAYVSAETHTWVQKASDLSGLGTAAVRWIPTDSNLRMDLDALRRQIDADRKVGEQPFMVVGAAGSVSTGAVDPLAALAALCRDQNLWFHVDGAYGGFAARVPGAPEDLQGLSLADSVAVDPHKWLYTPLEAGCALVRDPEKLRNAFSYHPPYYHIDPEVLNYVDFGPQNSRGFRALKVWLALKQVGAAGHREMIAQDMQLTRDLAEAVRRHAEFVIVTEPSLSIVTFRFVPKDLRARAAEPDVERYLDDLNQTLLDQSQRGGEAFVSNAVVRGRYALRACIVNFHTSRRDVEELPEILARTGRTLDRERRPASLGAAPA